MFKLSDLSKYNNGCSNDIFNLTLVSKGKINQKVIDDTLFKEKTLKLILKYKKIYLLFINFE